MKIQLKFFKENSQLKDKLDRRIENYYYTQTRNTIQRTLNLSQDAEQSKRSAQEEADRIIRKANDTAQKILESPLTMCFKLMMIMIELNKNS